MRALFGGLPNGTRTVSLAISFRKFYSLCDCTPNELKVTLLLKVKRRRNCYFRIFFWDLQLFSRNVNGPFTFCGKKWYKTRRHAIKDSRITDLLQIYIYIYIYIYICYSPDGRFVLGKIVPEVLDTARGRRPRALHKSEGTVFLNTDRPWLVNKIFIFF